MMNELQTKPRAPTLNGMQWTFQPLYKHVINVITNMKEQPFHVVGVIAHVSGSPHHYFIVSFKIP